MFETLVGQNLVKKKLQFYKESYDTSKRMPFLFFVGAKGLGKTEFAKQLAKEIKNTDGSRRPFLEINCSTLKRVDDIFEQIFLPLIYNNEVTVLFDEAHELPKGLTNAFLTIFNTDQDHIKDFNLNDQVFTFDFTKQSFFFATTESDKVFAPLKDRLITVDFEPYTKKELSEIISRVSVLSGGGVKGIKFNIGSESVLVSSNNPEQEAGEESFQSDFNGDDIEVAFSVNYIQEMLSNIDSEHCIFHIFGSEKGCLVTSTSDSELKYVIAPLLL